MGRELQELRLNYVNYGGNYANYGNYNYAITQLYHDSLIRTGAPSRTLR